MDIRTAKFTENEIAKSEDFNFLGTSSIDNLISIIQKVIGKTTNDCIVHGLEVQQVTPVSMNVKINSGLALLSNGTAIYVDTITNPIPIENGEAYDRIDILEVRAKTKDYDLKQRAFKDPGTGAITYIDVTTKVLFDIEAKVLKGTPGSGNAPPAESGWMKLAEILVPAGLTSGIVDAYIRNVSAYLPDLENTSWTIEKNRSWKCKNYVSLVQAFKNRHDDVGEHRDDVIKEQHIDWGFGAQQVSAIDVPVKNEGDLFSVGNVEQALEDTFLRANELATIRQKSTGIIVPMYLYPWSEGGWSTQFETFLDLLKKYQNVPSIVVINPNNGPGTVEDGVWRRAIKKIIGSGGIVSGYVYTSYTNRNINDVYTDIDRWRQLYPHVRSLFVDEMTNDNNVNHINYYKQITAYAHRKGFWPVIGNPGAPCYETYFTNNASDIIVIFENNYWPDENTLRGGDWEDSYREISLYRRACLVHGITSLNYDTLLMIMKYTGFIYVTSFTIPNPWNGLPSYIEDELRLLSTHSKYVFNQNLRTTDNVAFNRVDTSSLNGYAPPNQNLRTTDNATFYFLKRTMYSILGTSGSYYSVSKRQTITPGGGLGISLGEFSPRNGAGLRSALAAVFTDLGLSSGSFVFLPANGYIYNETDDILTHVARFMCHIIGGVVNYIGVDGDIENNPAIYDDKTYKVRVWINV